MQFTGDQLRETAKALEGNNKGRVQFIASSQVIEIPKAE